MSSLQETPLYRKALGCLLGGIIGDAMGAPTEGMDYRDIEARFGWIEDWTSDGTDDTVVRDLLAEALIRTNGYATLDDWAAVWLDHWQAIFGTKLPKFFISVVHTAQKLRHGFLPRMVALGNMPSSSSAMGISPVGIVNACNPAQAALQAYNLASLIHVHDVGFCQDGAAAIAAGVAAAMSPAATAETVVEAAIEAIVRTSGREMRERIEALLDLARDAAEYKAFRAAVFEARERFFCPIGCDSRETVPLALALFRLAEGDVGRCVVYAANFGRDSDTIGAMAGALAGALRGVGGIKEEWVDRARQVCRVSQEDLAARLCEVAVAKHAREQRCHSLFERIASTD